MSEQMMARLTAALQKCYDEHFLPVWGYPVDLDVTASRSPPTGSWSISTMRPTRIFSGGMN